MNSSRLECLGWTRHNIIILRESAEPGQLNFLAINELKIFVIKVTTARLGDVIIPPGVAVPLRMEPNFQLYLYTGSEYLGAGIKEYRFQLVKLWLRNGSDEPVISVFARDASNEGWLKAVTSDSAKAQAPCGDLERLRQYLHPTSSKLWENELLQKQFVGREWLFFEVEHWREEQIDSRIFWLVGDPGVGKSTFAARLARRTDSHVIAAYFCKHEYHGKDYAKDIIADLVIQIAELIPSYQSAIFALPGITDIRDKSAAGMFDMLIAGPLGETTDDHEGRLLIVIDALDEAIVAEDKPVDNLVNVLADTASHLPGHVALFVTSRVELSVLDPLRSQKPFVLNAASDENLNDIRAYLRAKLGTHLHGHQGNKAIIEQLVGKSEGLFLWTEWVCKDIHEGRLSLDRLEQFPIGLDGIYERFFNRQFNDLSKYKENVRPVLSAILVAKEPLDLGLLAEIMAWDPHDPNVISDFTTAVGSLFPTSKEADILMRTIRPFHKSVGDWLADDSKSGHYYISAELGEWKLAKDGFDRFKRNPMRLPRYHLSHLSEHLVRLQDWNRLCEVVSDLHYLHAKVQAGLLEAAIVEYQGFLQPEITVTLPRHEEIESLARFIRAQAHVLRVDPGAFLQQAMNQCDSSAIEGTARQILRESPACTIELLNKPRGRDPCIATLVGHAGYVHSVAFSPDGTTIASGSWDRTVKLWDATTGKIICTLAKHKFPVHSVAFSPDGATIASSSSDGTVKLWNVAKGKVLRMLRGHSIDVDSVVFSPDGATIASGSYDGTVKLWDAGTGGLLRTLTGHSGWVYSVAFSPDGATIASGSYDCTVKLWDAETGAVLRTLAGNSGSVHSVAFSPDGVTIASGSEDGTVKLWDAITGDVLRTLAGHSTVVDSVTFSPDGVTIASGSRDRTVKLWDAATGEMLRTLAGHASWVESVVFSPNGIAIASGSYDDTVKLWDAETSGVLLPLAGHSGTVESVAFSPDGATIASGSEDGTVKLWDAATGDVLRTLTSHIWSVKSVAFSPDGVTIASGSYDETVKLWDAATGDVLRTLVGQSTKKYSVAFSPDGTTIASGTRDNTVILWTTATGDVLRTLAGHSDVVDSVAFSPDGATIASGSWDGTLKLWDTATGELLRTFNGHSKWVASVVFSPDGATIASGSWDGTLKLWDTATGELLRTLAGHAGSVHSVAFSLDGVIIASGSSDRTVKLWDISTGEIISTFHSNESIHSIAWATKNLLAAGGALGTVSILRANLLY